GRCESPPRGDCEAGGAVFNVIRRTCEEGPLGSVIGAVADHGNTLRAPSVRAPGRRQPCPAQGGVRTPLRRRRRGPACGPRRLRVTTGRCAPEAERVLLFTIAIPRSDSGTVQSSLSGSAPAAR